MKAPMAARVVAGALTMLAVASPPALAEYGGHPSHRRPVVQIEDQHAGVEVACTGTLVRPRLVLTAGHCITPGSHAVAGGRYRARAVLVDPAYTAESAGPHVGAHDLAFLWLNANQRPQATPIPAGVYQLDAPAVSYGYGLPNLGTQTRASYTPVLNLPDYLAAFATPGESLGGGDSGGPLVQAGQVVAVNESTSGPGSEQNFAPLDQWAWNQIRKDR